MSFLLITTINHQNDLSKVCYRFYMHLNFIRVMWLNLINYIFVKALISYGTSTLFLIKYRMYTILYFSNLLYFNDFLAFQSVVTIFLINLTFFKKKKILILSYYLLNLFY